MKRILVTVFFVFSLFFVGCQVNDDSFTIKKVINALEIPSEVSEDFELPTNITLEDITATIVWESSNHDVLSNEGKVNQQESNVSVTLEATITVNQVSESCKFQVVVLAKKVVADEEKTYTITYNLNGGVCDNLITSFKENEEVVLPVPTKNGYKFLGWYQEGRKVDRIENQSYELIAKWEMENNPTLVVTCDVDKLFVDYDTELAIDGYDDLSEFAITASNDELVSIDPDGYVAAKKCGTVVITCTLKSNPNIFGVITLTIYPKSPALFLETQHVVVGKDFVLSDMNYDNFDDLELEYDESFIEYNNGFKALKAGTTTIKVSVKGFEGIYDEIEITIFDLLPQLSIDNNQIMIGSTSRIDVSNYDVEDLKFEANDPTIVTFDGKLVTAQKIGEVTVKVSLLNDPNVYSTIDLVVVPLQPELKLASENILVGGKTRLIIDNLKELEYTDLSDYKVQVLLSSLIATVDGEWFVEGKSLGVATIKVTAKNNEYISSTIEVNVVKTSTKLDSNGVITEGPLVLTIDDFDGYIHAGEMTSVKIDGVTDVNKYKWITSDDTILNVYEDGRIICIKEGSAYLIAMNPNNKEVFGRLYISIYGIPNVNYIDRLIKVAESQIGYREGANNDTKYGDWYGLPNEPWCAMFVSWCAYQAGIGTDVILKYCGCSAGMKWFVDNGRFGYKESYTPKAGDIIFFLSNGASHTGIVINCVGGRVYTIEGNTSNMCAKRSYDLNHSTITGYGIPNYPEYNGEVSGGDIGGSTDGGGSSTT